MLEYPDSRRDDTVEMLHGVRVPDPYRWLEGDTPEVAEWVAAQAGLAESVLASYPQREWFRARVHETVSQPTSGVPVYEGGRWYVSWNDGTHAQGVWYAADELEDLVRSDEVFLDPNTWSEDGTTALSTFAISKDARYLAYAVNEAGGDWQEIRVRDLRTGVEFPDRVRAKYSEISWLPDSRSFLYVVHDEAPEPGPGGMRQLGSQRLMRHRIGIDRDELVLWADGPNVFLEQTVSHDGNWVYLALIEGADSSNRWWMAPLVTEPGGESRIGEWIRVEDEARCGWAFLRCLGDSVLLLTDCGAPSGRVVRRAIVPGSEPEEVIPEQAGTIIAAAPLGDTILVGQIYEGRSRLDRFGLDGQHLGVVGSTVGSYLAMDSGADQSTATIGVSAINSPCTLFVVEEDGRARMLHLGARGETRTPSFTVLRHAATSLDGTPVPYSLVIPTAAEGPLPTLVFGYGGFNVPVMADFRPGWGPWLAAGGALVMANVRGGGEFGTDWYEAGWRENKHHGFEDFVAVADDLVRRGVTTRDQLALHGRSNGGLLAARAMTMRPDVAAAVLPAVGLLDMLRFHLFTVGGAWVTEYGDPGIPEEFARIRAYSPLHTVRDGERYPAVLLSVADHDDRVVPAHSYKFAAALQRAQAADAPVVLRVDRNTGHGHGKSRDLIIDEWADLMAFAAFHTGLVPPQ